ncbi:kinase-like domain-containing protein [Hyaloraphidium curvatum]|nr:kinase-like domain-containing protein [Hyaloraphidium curvatum]
MPLLLPTMAPVKHAALQGFAREGPLGGSAVLQAAVGSAGEPDSASPPGSTTIEHGPPPLPRTLHGTHDDWIVDEVLLGQGSFAHVRLAHGALSGREAVVKSTPMSPKDRLGAFFALREALVLAHLPRHPAVPMLLDIVRSRHGIHLVLARAPGVELLSHVISQPDGRLEEEEARRIVAGVLSALRHAHANGIIHRDIKPDNVLVAATGQVTLLDFGLATFFGSATVLDEAVGSLEYASPRMRRLLERGERCSASLGHPDLWSLGVLAHAVLAGRLPRCSEDIGDDREMSYDADLELPEGVSSDARSFLSLVLDPANEGRISASSLLRHPWVRPFADLSGTVRTKIPSVPSPEDGFTVAGVSVAAHLARMLPEHLDQVWHADAGDGEHVGGGLDPGGLVGIALPAILPFAGPANVGTDTLVVGS